MTKQQAVPDWAVMDGPPAGSASFLRTEAVGVGPCPACSSADCPWWKGRVGEGVGARTCSEMPPGWTAPTPPGWFAPPKQFCVGEQDWVLLPWLLWRAVGWIACIRARSVDGPPGPRGDFEVYLGPFGSHQEGLAVLAAALRMPLDRLGVALREIQQRVDPVRQSVEEQWERGARQTLLDLLRQRADSKATDSDYFRYRHIAEKALKEVGCEAGSNLEARATAQGVVITLTIGPLQCAGDVLEAMYDLARTGHLNRTAVRDRDKP